MNALKSSVEKTISELCDHLGGTDYDVSVHDTVPNVVSIRGRQPDTTRDLTPGSSVSGYVVVGEMCGLAVLRGAEVFCPGILAVSPPSLQPGDHVSVLADTRGTCLRGAKLFTGDTAHVANGVLMVSRDAIFRDNCSGVGVTITEKKYPCPGLDESLFSGTLMLQNLPSIVAVETLDPQPGETILDMCAAPGGKTTLIAQKMMNTGVVVAGDKSYNKITAINRNCDRQGITIVKALAMDGTKIVAEEDSVVTELSPPFPPGTFDRVLLDAPCSALGQRPQFFNKMKMKELRSFPKIQKKLFSSAVSLLKPGGVLLYSTCTNNTQENEDVVSWATENFDNLIHEKQLKFGHPQDKIDTITFFIAKFQKLK